MKDRYVFDTGPLLLFFAGDERVKSIFEEVLRGTAEGYTCEINVAELYYKVCQELGRGAAEIREKSIRSSRIRVLPLDEGLSHTAGVLKCMFRDISLADAYTLAAAKILNGVLVTTDSRLAELKVVRAKLIPTT